jgi:four helix bundle protein
MEHKNVVVEKSLDFSVNIIKFCELLETDRKFIIANQLLKSGTSIGANIFEAQHAESRGDFIHKMKIAIKEANETLYWLTICGRSESYPKNSSLKPLAEELIRIISKIILSSKRRLIGGILPGSISALAFLVCKLRLMMI